jgi:hypothetical protein
MTHADSNRLEILLRSLHSQLNPSYIFSPDSGLESQSEPNHRDETTDLPEFEYEKLASKGQTIRLLKLIAGTSGNPTIDCELVETRLDLPKHQKYEALSWCWGTSAETADIRIIGKRDRTYAKKAKPDLVHALRALRSNKRHRYLWIDAVCINQEDMDEKNQQVEMMAEIYGKAKRVCVWLGQPDDSSRLAIKFIRDEVLKLQDFDDLCDRESNSPKWKALLDLMQRAWFSRRWVVQEISLAQKALLYCGGDKISWNKFSVAVELFVEVETATHRLSEVMKKDRTFHHIPGWFDYVSQLGASLLVDATGRLFRDHKDIRQNLPAKERRLLNSQSQDSNHPGQDSDSDGISEDSGDEEEPQTNGVHAINGHRYGHGSALTKGSKTNLNMQAEQTPSRVNQLASTVKGQPLLGLEVLVSGLAIFDVTKAHDTIYALLAISKDTTPKATKSLDWKNHTQAALEQFTEQRRYEVDYKKPYVEVCQYFIKFCIHRALKVDASRALDLILRPWAVEEPKVAERFEVEMREQYKKEAERRKKKGLHTETHSKAGNAMEVTGDDSAELLRRDDYIPLPSWVPQLSRAPFAMQRAAGVSGQKVGRTNADPLVGFPNQNIRNYKAAETKELDIRTLKFRQRKGWGVDNYYSMFVKGFVLDTITEVKDASQSGNIPSEWADFAGWSGARGDPPDAFWRTLVGDRGKDGKNPPVYYARACKESFEKGGYLSGSISTSDLIRNERVSVIAQFCWRVQSVIWKRALAKTESGRLALVAPGVKEGDLVCVLYGCSVPVVLRMSPEKSLERISQEAKLELEVLANHLKACAQIWLARTRHYQEKRRKEKAKYRVWEMAKKLLFFKETKWRTEWKWKREKIEAGALLGSDQEIARKERFERALVGGVQGKEDDKVVKQNGLGATLDHGNQAAEHNMQGTFATQQTPVRQHMLRPEELPDWEHIGDKMVKKNLLLTDIRGDGFHSKYDQHLQGCEFDDWKREMREKARKQRDKATVDPIVGNEDTWLEPRVNWREFELRLTYGRRWRKILQTRHQEEEKEIMELRDKKRQARGFKLRERPTKKEVRRFDTEEIERNGKKWTQLTKEAALDVEEIWLENVRRALRNESREKSSDEAPEDEASDGDSEPTATSARSPSISDKGSKTSLTEDIIEKSRQSFRFSYNLLGDCYLHGMMDGEAMAVQNGHSSEKAIPAVVFEIR